MFRIFIIIFFYLFLCGCQHTSTIKPNPEAALLNSQLGLAYLKLGDVTNAQQKLMLAVEEAPNQAGPLDALAYFYEHEKHYSLARQYYQKALNDHAHRIAAENNFGAFLCRVGQYEEGREHLSKALRDPYYRNQHLARQNLAVCQTGIVDLG